MIANQAQKVLGIESVAIVDDDQRAAAIQGEQVLDAGFQPIVVTKHYAKVNDLVAHIVQSAQGAICDHRLSGTGFATFTGAELVASLFKSNIPAILITTFLNQDHDVSIRRYRRYIPVLLSRENFDVDTIRSGLGQVSRELTGHVPATRKPHRSLLRVCGLRSVGGEDVLDVIIPSWNPDRAVTFPAGLLPWKLLSNVKRSLKKKRLPRLVADVNIGAEQDDDIFFENFDEAPEPDQNDGLA